MYGGLSTPPAGKRNRVGIKPFGGSSYDKIFMSQGGN